jgi:hypothetical protein
MSRAFRHDHVRCAGQGVLYLELRPHIEHAGCHRDRFDAYLAGQLICTSRSGWHTPARELLRLGYPPETLLRVQHAGRPFDPTIIPRPLGEVAKWFISEEAAAGLKRRRWQPLPEDPLATMYPDLWTEPSGWPWGGPPGVEYASSAREEHSPPVTVPADDLDATGEQP